jgi:hypothetical protein
MESKEPDNRMERDRQKGGSKKDKQELQQRQAIGWCKIKGKKTRQGCKKTGNGYKKTGNGL